MSKSKRATDTIEVTLDAYQDWDLTGGGPPFGHFRGLHVELTTPEGKIVRDRKVAEKLRGLVQERGEPIGEGEVLPRESFHRGGTSQKYRLQGSLTNQAIKKAVPFVPIQIPR